MSKVLKWLEIEAERLEKECDTNDYLFKTVNHSFIQGFNYALANVEVIELEESKLNENQQIVLDWLKTLPLFPISAVYLLEAGKNVPNNVKNAYENFDKKEEAEVLQAFSQWAIEQEEK